MGYWAVFGAIIVVVPCRRVESEHKLDLNSQLSNGKSTSQPYVGL